MGMRRTSRGQLIGRYLTATLLVIGMTVAPSVGSPAAASAPATHAAPATLAAPTAHATIPDDVAALIARGPADIIVGMDPAPGATAAARVGGAQTDAAERQVAADSAATVYAVQKRSALASAGPGVRTVRALDALPVQVVRVDTPAALAALAAAPGVTSLSVPELRRTTARRRSRAHSPAGGPASRVHRCRGRGGGDRYRRRLHRRQCLRQLQPRPRNRYLPRRSSRRRRRHRGAGFRRARHECVGRRCQNRARSASGCVRRVHCRRRFRHRHPHCVERHRQDRARPQRPGSQHEPGQLLVQHDGVHGVAVLERIHLAAGGGRAADRRDRQLRL